MAIELIRRLLTSRSDDDEQLVVGRMLVDRVNRLIAAVNTGGTAAVGGGWRIERFVEATGDVTAQIWDMILADATAGQMIVTLPDFTVADYNKIIVVKAVGELANAVVIRPASGTIDGAPEFITASQGGITAAQRRAGGVVMFISTSAGWSALADVGVREERQLDAQYSPLGLWCGGGGFGVAMTDLSGNGNHMSLEAGTARYSSFSQRVAGILMDGATSWYVTSGYVASLALLGEMSIIVIGQTLVSPSAGAFRPMFVHSGTVGSAVEAQNNLWGIAATQFMDGRWFHENGGGTPNTAIAFVPPLLQSGMAGITRDSAQGIQAYGNGQAYGAVQGPLTAPTGGTSGRVRIGGDVAGANGWTGLFLSAAVYSPALTAAKHMERYNWSLGAKYGFRRL